MRLAVMREALNVTGRPILLSTRDSSEKYPAVWSSSATANVRQASFPVHDKWERMLHRMDVNELLWRDAGPGNFNDADLLEIGNGGMSTREYQTHMTMWSILKSPLLIGSNLTSISEADLKILMNPEVISVSQDPLGAQAHRVWSNGHPSSKLTKYLMKHTWSKSDQRSAQQSVIVDSCDEYDPLQKWRFAHNGSFVLHGTGGCLEQECEDMTNVPVSMKRCGLSECPKKQAWRYHKDDSENGFHITSVATGHCLTLQPKGRKQVMTAPCAPKLRAFQTWLLDDKTGQFSSPVSTAGGHESTKACLAVAQHVRPGAQEVWAGQLTGGKSVVVLLNRHGSNATRMEVKWDQLQWHDSSGAATVTPNLVQVRDLWEQKDMGLFASGFSTEVAAHGVVMLLLDQHYAFMQSANWTAAMAKASKHLVELNGLHSESAFLDCDSNSTFNPWAHYANVSFSVRARMLASVWQHLAEPTFLDFLVAHLHVPKSRIVTQSLLQFGPVVGAKYNVLVLRAHKKRVARMLSSTSTAKQLTKVISHKFGKFRQLLVLQFLTQCWI
jgi:hypothetical protein